MTIVIGADHGGYKLKEAVKKHLINEGYNVEDVGTFTEESVDYPDIARDIAKKYNEIKADYILAFCGTGIGISIALNKLEGIYCAVIYNDSSSRLAKEHNNVNSVAMGGRELNFDDAIRMVDIFLTSKPMEKQHRRRREKIGYC